MATGKRPDGDIFASGASEGEVLTFPDINRGWGITTDGKGADGEKVTDPTNGIPPMEWFNALQLRTDQNILWLLQNALPAWSAGTWPQGATVVNNDIVYRAQKETATEPDESNGDWLPLFPLQDLDGRYLKLTGGTITGTLNIGHGKWINGLAADGKTPVNIATVSTDDKVFLGERAHTMVIRGDGNLIHQKTDGDYQIYDENNKPAAADVDAVSASKGGTFKADVTCTGTFTAKLLKSTSVVWAQGQSNYLPATQGAYLGWNRTSGSGAMDFINHRGSGSGGFCFWNGDGTTQTNIATISAGGGLTLKGGLAVAASSTFAGTVTMNGSDPTVKNGNQTSDDGTYRQTNGYRIAGASDLFADLYHYEQIGSHHSLSIHVANGGSDGWFEFRNDGGFYSGAGIFEAGQRVYSPNNPPPATTSASLGESGWWKDEKTGLIRQWGRVAGVVQQSVNFPIAFPSACTSVVLGQVYNSTEGQSGTARLMNWVSNTGFTAYIGTAESGYYWEATGY